MSVSLYRTLNSLIIISTHGRLGHESERVLGHGDVPGARPGVGQRLPGLLGGRVLLAVDAPGRSLALQRAVAAVAQTRLEWEGREVNEILLCIYLEY